MFSFDKKYLYIILAAFVIFNIGGYINSPESLLNLVLSLPAVFIAITFHEFAHAFAADKLGDDTPRRQGRLNLNPFSHIDPFGFVLLLFAGFGWGKPVQVNSRNYNRKRSMAANDAIVSFAGPLMNFILAIVFTIIYYIIQVAVPGFIGTQVGLIVMIMIQMIIVMNIGLGVFNLIPLPPLDGSKILYNFLPYNGKQWFKNNEQIFYIIFMVIWVTGIGGWIVSPIIDAIYNGLDFGIANLFGLFIK